MGLDNEKIAYIFLACFDRDDGKAYRNRFTVSKMIDVCTLMSACLIFSGLNEIY